MKNTFILFLVALSFVCSSCNRTPSVEEPDVLKVLFPISFLKLK